MKQDFTKEIIEKCEAVFSDFSAHSYNNYTDESEVNIQFSLAEVKWLYNHFSDEPYYF